MDCNKTLSYIHNVGKEPLKPLTMGMLLHIAAKRFSKHEAVIFCEKNEKMTYGQLYEESNKLAASLCNIGLKYGERIGIWCPNMTEWIVVSMASLLAGFVVVALNPHCQAPELEYFINKMDIKVIVCPFEIKYQSFYKTIADIAPEVKTSKSKILNCKRIPSLMSIILISNDVYQGAFTYGEIMSLSNEKGMELVKYNQSLIQTDNPCFVLMSSGTTGVPKAVTLSHFHVVNSGYFSGKCIELHLMHHKICVQVPFFHSFGAIVTISSALNFGSTMVIPTAKYNPLANFKAIIQEKCSCVFGTPTMYTDLIRIRKELNEDSRLEVAVVGAAPCSPELLKQMKTELNVKKIKSVYGMTELSGGVFFSQGANESDNCVRSTVGQISDHWEAKVVNEAGKIVCMGEPGELCIRGYASMLSYWGDEEATKEIRGNDGWLRTGDKFVLQSDGYGKVVGRIKDMINRGGENVFPKEIEDHLITHPLISDVQVIGLPHKRLGEEVCVCVVLKDHSKICLEDIQQYCKGTLSFCKIPTKLYILKSFPKTASGKIQKHKLQQVVTDVINVTNINNNFLTFNNCI